MSILALMKSLDLFAKERSVVVREQMRNNYFSIEYLLAKVVAEIPLDTSFALAFAYVLKSLTGLRSSMKTLIQTYCLMTITSASLGFAIGSFTSSVESAMSTGVSLFMYLLLSWIWNFLTLVYTNLAASHYGCVYGSRHNKSFRRRYWWSTKSYYEDTVLLQSN